MFDPWITFSAHHGTLPLWDSDLFSDDHTAEGKVGTAGARALVIVAAACAGTGEASAAQGLVEILVSGTADWVKTGVPHGLRTLFQEAALYMLTSVGLTCPMRENVVERGIRISAECAR